MVSGNCIIGPINLRLFDRYKIAYDDLYIIFQT